MKSVSAGLLTVAALAVFVHTQAPQPTFRTEANYVRVDAYATRNGAPVTDLTRDDFEILESGQPQALEQFERIDIRGSVPQNARIEPNTVAESRAMAESSRGRVFVIFLDTYHVEIAGSHNIRGPLISALDRLIGPDDVVAVMTPEMSPRDITFARKTVTIDGLLTRYWHWGERDRLNPSDPRADEYLACYPPQVVKCPDGSSDDARGVAAEMIGRQHEHTTLNALHDLVLYLRGVREERKAVIAISDGWLQFRPDPRLARRLNCQIPTQSAGIIPGTGRLTGRSPREPNLGNASSDVCEAERQILAAIDDEQIFRQLLDEANTANVSFYPLDPRGLPVFDTPISAPAPPAADAAMLRTRIETLRTLAEATDGLAMVNNNQLDKSFQKIVADLSSYYLLGYYSTGKLDGKFHQITVKVKRPGIQVRARRGYLAATPAAAARMTRESHPDAPPSAADAEALAIESVLRPLSAFTRETSLRLRAATGWKADGKPRVWVVGEVGRADTWQAGAEADVTLSREGETLATAHVAVPAGTRTFKIALEPSTALPPGDYSVAVRTVANSLMATSNDLIPLPLPAAPQGLGSVIVRKGPFTGLKEIPTADLRFRRSEQMRIEIPIGSADNAAAARMLDRNGKLMAGIPMAAVVRDDPDGSRWATAQVPLFPLAPGDYIVEIAVGNTKTLTPFRVVQ
jgi:VWFA-related protein